MEVSPLASAWMENPTDQDRLLLKDLLCQPFEDNKVSFYRVRQMEPCYRLGEVARHCS